MHCKRCPHLIKHGKADVSGNIYFLNNCGLLMKADMLEAGVEVAKKPGRKPTKPKERPARRPIQPSNDEEYACKQVPFPETFEYLDCDIYRETFKGGIRKSSVIPTKDIHFSNNISVSSIADLELL